MVPVETPHHSIEQFVEMDATLGIHTDLHLYDFSLDHHFCVIIVFHALET